MFPKIALFALASSALAAATGTTTVDACNPAATTLSQCNTGAAQCCNNMHDAKSSAVAHTLGLLGIVVQGVDVLVGTGCIPIVGTTCAQQPVCCQNNQFNGVINIGCTPISL